MVNKVVEEIIAKTMKELEEAKKPQVLNSWFSGAI